MLVLVLMRMRMIRTSVIDATIPPILGRGYARERPHAERAKVLIKPRHIFIKYPGTIHHSLPRRSTRYNPHAPRESRDQPAILTRPPPLNTPPLLQWMKGVNATSGAQNMASTQLKDLNEFHEKLARWTLQNPHKTLREASTEFGYSTSWLSIIMNSDAFRARMGELNASADALVLADIPARLRGLANSSLDVLAGQIDAVITSGVGSVRDRDFVKDTADMTLKALGYGRPSAPSAQQQTPGGVNIFADRVLVQSARERILEKGRVIEGSHNALPDRVEHDTQSPEPVLAGERRQ